MRSAVLGEGPHAVGVVGVDAEHGRLDVVAVEVVQQQGDRVDALVEVGGHVLEHVLRRHLVVLALLVPQVRRQELVDLLAVPARHPDEGLDDADVAREPHVRLPLIDARRTRIVRHDRRPRTRRCPPGGGWAGIASRSGRGTRSRVGFGPPKGDRAPNRGDQAALCSWNSGTPARTSSSHASISSSLARRRYAMPSTSSKPRRLLTEALGAVAHVGGLGHQGLVDGAGGGGGRAHRCLPLRSFRLLQPSRRAMSSRSGDVIGHPSTRAEALIRETIEKRGKTWLFAPCVANSGVQVADGDVRRPVPP